jgi:hypothetical protein
MTDNVTSLPAKGRQNKTSQIHEELAHLRSENARLLAEVGGLRSATTKGSRSSYWNGFATGGGFFGLFGFIGGACMAVALATTIQHQTLPVAQEAVARGAIVAGIVHGDRVTPEQLGGK